MYKIILFILLIVTTITHNNVFAIEDDTSKEKRVQYVPESPFFDENNDKLYLDQYEGKVILLVFWATWCESCIHEMSSLDILQKDFKKLPFEIIALSQDFQGINAVKDFFKNHKIRHIKPYHDYKNKLFNEMNISTMPSAILVDTDGIVMIHFKGRVKWHDEQIREQILSYIPGNPVNPKNTYKESFNIANPKINDTATENDKQSSEDIADSEEAENKRGKTDNDTHSK